ncbi:hypothetical protein GJ496_004618, partial [Pomphorhynchus laevis]
ALVTESKCRTLHNCSNLSISVTSVNLKNVACPIHV